MSSLLAATALGLQLRALSKAPWHDAQVQSNVNQGRTAYCRRSGRAVIVASMSGFVGMAGFSTYAPTKFALRGLADCLRNEVGLGIFALCECRASIT